MIPPKPKGSSIEELPSPDGYTFRWPMPSAGLREYLSPLPVLLIVAYLIYQWGWRFPGGGLGQVGWLWLVFVLPLLLGLAPLVRLMRQSRPESITLLTDSFRHDLGRATGYLSYADSFQNRGLDRRSPWEQYFGPPLVIEAAKGEVGPVVLEKVGGTRLRYDLGADRIEIGRFLREPEKEWLAQVILEWQKSA